MAGAGLDDGGIDGAGPDGAGLDGAGLESSGHRGTTLGCIGLGGGLSGRARGGTNLQEAAFADIERTQEAMSLSWGLEGRFLAREAGQESGLL